MEVVESLRRLSESFGVSGFEDEVRGNLIEILKEYTDGVKTDKMGNVIAYKKGTDSTHKILIASHLDEIGLMITKVDEGGYLKFTEVGRFDPRILLAQEVIVHGVKDLWGVVGAKPPHLQEKEERDKIVKREDMFIDVGLSEEEVKKTVKVGDVVSMAREFTPLTNDIYLSKAFDNRASVVSMIGVLENLKGSVHRWDVYGVATVQEEVTGLGAVSSAYGIYPDIALALDVTHGDMSKTDESETYKLNGGPVIAVGPNISKKVFDDLKKTAEDMELAYQIEPCASITGTDADDMQIVKEGIPTGVVSIPLRYMHSSVETLSIKDIERVSRLISEYIKRL